ncbi:hypothetical protein N9W34_05855 [Rickettsiales bacterium]|nr:hypothetical protein [Rickettsiales bacterium]
MAFNMYKVKILAFLLCFLYINNVFARDVYDSNVAEYYYTAERDKCLVNGMPSAFSLGDALSYGTAIAKNYSYILQSVQFSNEYYPEAAELAYAFYIIADRIGDPRAKAKIEWLYNYVTPEGKELVKTIIYRKFSKPYLQKCFSVNVEVAKNPEVNIEPSTNNARPAKRKMTEEELFQLYVIDNGQ